MESLALVGSVGGAGTTRTALELGAALATDGRSVAVLDAAYATQGLGDHVPGRIDPDMTTLTLEDGPLSAGLVDLDGRWPGRVAVCPADAPFERLARAKQPEAARRFEARVAEATGTVDHVIVDTPPVAANQAVAAVTCVERVAVVTPATARGDDGLPRIRDRLADVGVTETETVRTFADGEVAGAALAIPTSPVTAPAEIPVGGTDDAFGAAVVAAAERLFGVELPVELESPGMLGRFREDGIGGLRD